MASALSPREIQARIRSGASIAELADEAGVNTERIEVFAGPVLAEREHMAGQALQSAIRRRGNGHRRLLEVITERLQARGIDAETISWDAWRLPDLRWQVVGSLTDDAAARSAEFVFDPRGRFSVAGNADARWMIGEQLPGATSPDNENTVDFDDELALVRATQDAPPTLGALPGDDIPQQDQLYEDAAHTSELDELYDLMSGISEDSVRIYVGLTEEEAEPLERGDATEAAEPDEEPDVSVVVEEQAAPDDGHPEPEEPQEEQAAPQAEEEPEPALLEEPEPAPRPAKRRRKGRAAVPSWDEIMFGGRGGD